MQAFYLKYKNPTKNDSELLRNFFSKRRETFFFSNKPTPFIHLFGIHCCVSLPISLYLLSFSFYNLVLDSSSESHFISSCSSLRHTTNYIIFAITFFTKKQSCMIRTFVSAEEDILWSRNALKKSLVKKQQPN